MNANDTCPFCKRKLSSEAKFPCVNFQCNHIDCGTMFSNIENHYFRFYLSSISEITVDIDFHSNMTIISDDRKGTVIYSLNDVFDLHQENQLDALMKIVNRVVNNLGMT